MDRVSVKSSNIDSIGYDEQSMTLEIEFKDGSVYRYKNVPLDEYEGLIGASSHGVYFHNNIKNSYQTIKL